MRFDEDLMVPNADIMTDDSGHHRCITLLMAHDSTVTDHFFRIAHVSMTRHNMELEVRWRQRLAFSPPFLFEIRRAEC